jgi:signal transduction histidine kinase
MNSLNFSSSKEELESKRLKTLAQYKILYTDPSAEFDDLAMMATFLFNAPYAFISFIDDKEQWLKSSFGLPFNTISLQDSFCLSLINRDFTSVLISEDLTKEPKSQTHPLVNGFPYIKSFVSVPITSPNGLIMGSIAVLDNNVRTFTQQQIVSLKTLADQVISKLELMKSNDELRKTTIQLSKLTDLGVYATTIAHEINTPLTIMTSQVDLLTSKLQSGSGTSIDEMKRFVGSCERNVSRISKIVSGLKKITRNGENDPLETVYVSSIFDDIHELCSKKVRDNEINLEFIRSSNNLSIDCRNSQISQVLVNLISNSIDAIKELPSKWIKVNCEESGLDILISVTDSGNGIPDEVSDKMFSHFYSTKAIGQGTGIGLTVATEILKNHKGEIFLDKQNVNTKFVLRIPKKQLS